jgi:hypothetical protein
MADQPTLTRQELPDIVHKREVARKIDAVVNRGAVNWVAEGTLSAGAGATTTTFEHDAVTTDSQISLHALTPEAAALLGKCWITLADLVPGVAWSGSEVGKFTVRHPALLSGVVATFRFSIKG